LTTAALVQSADRSRVIVYFHDSCGRRKIYGS